MNTVAVAPVVGRDAQLRPLVRQGAGPGRPALVEGLWDLGRLFGDLSLPPGPELGDPGLERTRLFESVCRLLERASARQPLALLLDDVHWADRGSLALLHYLVRGLATRPLLVLLAYREDEADPALRELLAGLRRGGSLTELQLAGLTNQAVRMLAQNLLGGDAPAGLLDVLAARSGGVPLFVGALVGSFVDSGALYRYDGRWALAPQHPEVVPAVVSVLLQSQVERLPNEAREVLDLLAVCGAQVDHALLERLMPGDRLLCGLGDLRAAGLVVEEVTDGRIRYRAESRGGVRAGWPSGAGRISVAGRGGAARDGHWPGRPAAPGRSPGIGCRALRTVWRLPEGGCGRTGGRRALCYARVAGVDTPSDDLPVW